MSAFSSQGPDPTLLELFRAEVDQHLPALNDGLLALEKGATDPQQYGSLMRAAHSIKGAARIIGNDPAVRVAHAMEDCLTAARDGKITLGSAAVDILLQGVDTLGRMCVAESADQVGPEALETILGLLLSVKDQTVAPAKPKPVVETIVIPQVLDQAAVESLRSQFCSLSQAAPQAVRLDFSGVERASAMFLAVLMSFARSARTAQIRVEALRVRPAVRSLLGVSGLENVFSIVD